MLATATPAGGAAHGMASLSDSERHAAQNVLAKLKQSGSGAGSHFGNESATVSSGSLSLKPFPALGASTLLSARGSDTFMGGVRSAPLSDLRVGDDTVVSGSTTKLGMHSASEAIASRGAQHFALSADTINVAGVTAAHVQTGHTAETKGSHTVTLADKTTIKIAGLSAHDISKLHH
jgi:hypothetical protein